MTASLLIAAASARAQGTFDAGSAASLALDGTGAPHVAFTDMASGQIRYATRQGPNSWSTERTFAELDMNQSQPYNPFVLTMSGVMPFLSYQRRVHVTDVPGCGSNVAFDDLEIGRTFKDPVAQQWMFMSHDLHWEPGACEYLNPCYCSYATGFGTAFLSPALSSSRSTAISAQLFGSEIIGPVWRGPLETWNALSAAIAVGPGGLSEPCVVYNGASVKFPGLPAVTLARKVAGQWKTRILGAITPARHPAIAVDAQGHVHVFFSTFLINEVGGFALDGPLWYLELIPSNDLTIPDQIVAMDELGTGSGTSLALDANHRPVVAWISTSGGFGGPETVYARVRASTGAWEDPVVLRTSLGRNHWSLDSSVPLEAHTTSMQHSPDGTVHLAYPADRISYTLYGTEYAWEGYGLRYARYAGGAWSQENVYPPAPYVPPPGDHGDDEIEPGRKPRNDSARELPAPPLLSVSSSGNEVRVRFRLEQPADCRVELYDVLGRRVGQRVLGTRDLGIHDAVLPTTGVQAGIYLVRVLSNARTLGTKRVGILR
jgi:hypothetical protein